MAQAETFRSTQAWLALYGAAWTLLAWPWLSGAVTIPWDAKAHFYPQLQFLAQSIHRGDLPFWAPFVFSGQPQVADPQSLIFSPPFLALAALVPDPGFRAFDAVVLGMLGLGGAFLIPLFRDRGWHPAGALVAAIVFAFGASAAWRVQHVGQVLSLAAWPIAYWLLMRALDRSSLSYGLAAGLAAGALALGRDQVAYLGLWLLVGATVAHWLQAPASGIAIRRSLGPLIAGAVGGALVATVPIGLTLLFAEGSNRPAVDYAAAVKGSVHPALLLTALVPNLFGVDGPFADYWGPPSPLWGPVDRVLARNMGVLYLGALPLALLVAGGVKGLLLAREVRFFSLGLAAMLLYALGGATPVFRLAFNLLPGADLFRRPADATFFVGAFGAILSGYLVHRLWQSPIRSKLPTWGIGEALIAMGAFAAAMALALTKGTMHIAAWPLVSASVFLAMAVALLSTLPTLTARRPGLALALILALVVADLAWNNGPNESTALPPSTYDVLRPDSRNETLAAIKERLGPGSLDRVELTALGFHWPNASLVHRLHNVLGYNPVRLGLYTQATGAGDHVALPEQRTFAPFFPSYRSPAADLLGLRLIATGVPVERLDSALEPGDLTLLATTPDGFLYENPRALPRAYFAAQAVAADPTSLLRDGFWPAVDLRTTVVLPDIPAETASPPASSEPASVTIVSYRNAEIVIDVGTTAAGYLVLNDPYHPWWSAEVDGREAPVLRANGLFRAVRLASGAHRVRFVFRPFRGAWRDARRRWPLLDEAQRLLGSSGPWS